MHSKHVKLSHLLALGTCLASLTYLPAWAEDAAAPVAPPAELPAPPTDALPPMPDMAPLDAPPVAEAPAPQVDAKPEPIPAEQAKQEEVKAPPVLEPLPEAPKAEPQPEAAPVVNSQAAPVVEQPELPASTQDFPSAYENVAQAPAPQKAVKKAAKKKKKKYAKKATGKKIDTTSGTLSVNASPFPSQALTLPVDGERTTSPVPPTSSDFESGSLRSKALSTGMKPGTGPVSLPYADTSPTLSWEGTAPLYPNKALSPEQVEQIYLAEAAAKAQQEEAVKRAREDAARLQAAKAREEGIKVALATPPDQRKLSSFESGGLSNQLPRVQYRPDAPALKKATDSGIIGGAAKPTSTATLDPAPTPQAPSTGIEAVVLGTEPQISTALPNSGYSGLTPQSGTVTPQAKALSSQDFKSFATIETAQPSESDSRFPPPPIIPEDMTYNDAGIGFDNAAAPAVTENLPRTESHVAPAPIVAPITTADSPSVFDVLDQPQTTQLTSGSTDSVLPPPPKAEASQRVSAALQSNVTSNQAVAAAQQPPADLPESGLNIPAIPSANASLSAESKAITDALTAPAPSPAPTSKGLKKKTGTESAVGISMVNPDVVGIFDAAEEKKKERARAKKVAKEAEENAEKESAQADESSQNTATTGEDAKGDKKRHKKRDLPFDAEETSEDDERTEDMLGLKIKVKRQDYNENKELEEAYQTLLAGRTAEAIDIYKEVLSVNPNNTTALFGLATTYHKAGRIGEARPVYGRLLKIDPDNREALSNFLALISEESPEGALEELVALEQKNSNFSPIPAQMAILYDKLGQPEAARNKMIRAVSLSPENLVYRYNLAVMLDKQGLTRDAASLYRELIDASRQGKNIPAPVDDIQKRLTFILSNQ